SALDHYERGIRELEAVVHAGKRNAQVGPSLCNARSGRALALARLSDHAQATAEATTLLREETLSAEALHHLACAYGCAADAVRGDAQIPSAEREKLAEQYSDRALDLLTKLGAEGYFKESDRVKKLQQSKDFDLLRPREDFQQFVAGLRDK